MAKGKGSGGAGVGGKYNGKKKGSGGGSRGGGKGASISKRKMGGSCPTSTPHTGRGGGGSSVTKPSRKRAKSKVGRPK